MLSAYPLNASDGHRIFKSYVYESRASSATEAKTNAAEVKHSTNWLDG